MTQRIFTGNANASSSNSRAFLSRGSGVSLVQVYFPPGTTGTITLSGRLSEDLPWTVLKTYTASALEAIVAVPYIQAALSGVAGGGTVVVDVEALQ